MRFFAFIISLLFIILLIFSKISDSSIQSIDFNTYKLLEKTDNKLMELNILLNAKIERISQEMNTIKKRLNTTVTLTAYSPREQETDDTPYKTACATKVKAGTVAVSHDLFWAGYACGRKIYIEGYGIFTVNDLMNERYKNRIDIFYWDTEQAYAFGKKENVRVNIAYIN